MAIYFANQPLYLEDLSGEAKRWLDRYLQFEEINLFGSAPTAISDGRLDSRGGCPDPVGLPTPNYPDAPPLKINSLYWPTGATRWARGVFLADTTTKNAILEATLIRGVQVTPAQLIMSSFPANNAAPDSFAENTFSTEMYLLPPRPVSEVDVLNPGTEELWLIPLVDVRYYWQFRHVGSFEPATWGEAYTLIATSLGLSLANVPTVASAYDIPSPSEHWRSYANSAYMLDAVAWSVGHRITRTIDGSVLVQSTTEAETSLSNNAAADSWLQVAGGTINPVNHLAGVIPEKVVVTFRDSAGDFAIAIEESATDHGYTGYVPDTRKVIHTNFPYDSAAPTPAVNLADQIAEDFYAWNANRYDRTFIGIKEWTPSGFDDYIEFSAGRRRADGSSECQTRVQTFPYNFGVDEMPQSGEACNSDSAGLRSIRFEICEACCAECWADVTILSKSHAGAVPGAGNVELACGGEYYYGDGSDLTVDLPAYKVRVYDKLGCFLNEAAADLVGRRGYALYMIPDPTGCDGDLAEDICDGVPLPLESGEGEPRWEIISLCGPNEICE